jgi:hypothetical protein
MTYTLVTVAHEFDYPLLRLQAHSLARYLPADFTDAIYVIANQGLRGNKEWQRPLLHDYGYLADKIHFLDACEVAAIPENIEGWHSQQILKLMIARVVVSQRYIVLDAKNHLVFPLSSEFYENGDRIRSTSMNYQALDFRPYLENSLRYFGIAEEAIFKPFLPTITPFILPTWVVNALTACIAQREQMPFPSAFQKLGTTEFFLFGGFLGSSPGGIGKLYDMSGPCCPVIWPQTAVDGRAAVDRVAARVERERLPFFSVHRRAFPLLDERSKQTIAGLWVRRHLFDDLEDALRRWLNNPARPQMPRAPGPQIFSE